MQMIDLMKRLAELDAKNSNVVKEGQLDPIKGDLNVFRYFLNGSQEFRGNEAPVQKAILDWLKQAAGLPPDAPLEFDHTDIIYNGDIVVRGVLWGEGLTFNDVVDYIKDYLEQQTGGLEQGVAEGSQGDYTFTTTLDNDQEIIVTYVYNPAELSKDSGPLASTGHPDNVQIVSVTDSETGEDVSNMVDIDKLTQQARDDYDENHQRDDRYESLAECGMMGSGMSQPSTPASINMTAASGEELSGMLRDIMSLAGVKPVTTQDLGHEHDPSVMSTVPGMGVASAEPESEPLDMRDMIAKIDSMNSDDDEKEIKTDETISSMPDPQIVPVPPGTHDPAGSPGAGKGRGLANHPVATPQDTYESLMSDYRKFVAESDQGVAEGNESKQEYHDRMHRLAAGYKGMSPEIRARKERIPGWKDQYAQALAYVEKHPKKDKQGVAEGAGFGPFDPDETLKAAMPLMNKLREFTSGQVDYDYNKDGSIHIVVNRRNDNPRVGWAPKKGDAFAADWRENFNNAYTPFFNAFRQKGWYFSQPRDNAMDVGVPAQQGVAEGSRTAQPGKHTPLNSPARQAAAAAQKEKMAKAAAAEPGQALLNKIKNKK